MLISSQEKLKETNQMTVKLKDAVECLFIVYGGKEVIRKICLASESATRTISSDAINDLEDIKIIVEGVGQTNSDEITITYSTV